jgi:glycosyl transferase, family 25
MEVYVVNLDRHADRRRWIEKTLGDAGVAFRRVRAADGNRFSPRTVACLTEGNFIKISRFQIARIISHRRAWRSILRSTAERSAVFEDDLRAGRDLKSLLDELDTGCIPFDLVKLETFNHKVVLGAQTLRCSGRELRPLLSTHWGSGAYVINRRAASALLRVTATLAGPIDYLLFDKGSLKSNGLTVLQMIPAAVIQEKIANPSPSGELKTTFLERASTPKPKGRRKIAREITRPFRQLAKATAAYGGILAGRRWMRIEFE